MTSTTAWLTASALLLSGCVIREVHEVHHVRDDQPRASSASGICDRCDASNAPGAVMAESQPPAPLQEEALDQPGPGYVWTDGYWDWNGNDWQWVGGDWVAPVDDQVFLPPAYYAYGGSCLYVPGRWVRGDHRPVRDHRTVRNGDVRDHRTGRGGDVRDHRGEKPDQKPPRDHRGDDRGVVDRGGGDYVISVPPRRPRHAADRAAPARSADAPDAVGTVSASDAASDVVDGRGDQRDSGRAPDRASDGGGPRGVVIIPPPRARPDRPGMPSRAAPERGPEAAPSGPGTMVAPPAPPSSGGWSRPGAPTGWSRPGSSGGWSRPGAPTGWSRPGAPPSRSAPSSPGGIAQPSGPPPRPSGPPVRVAPNSRPAPPASAPASSGDRARPAPPTRSSAPARVHHR
ncbi:MAG TPA: hypothetical protein VK698_20215 [Kofleriaceae bacterium]|nr:hypothetical protein [Kofleriaceae bacterium]